MDLWNSAVGSLVLEVPPPQTPDFWHRYLKSASQCFIRMSFAAARWSWKEDSDFECVGGWILDEKKCFQKENWWFVWELLYSSQYTSLHIILVVDRTQQTEHPKTKPNQTYQTSVSPLFDRTIDPNRTFEHLHFSSVYYWKFGMVRWNSFLAEPLNRTELSQTELYQTDLYWTEPNFTEPNFTEPKR